MSSNDVLPAAPPSAAPRYWLHLLLFLLTALSTTAVGARLAQNFARNRAVFDMERDVLAFMEPFYQPSLLWQGLPFSATLLAILLAHEMGHYLACMRYRLDASLPYFLPAPTFIGTFGAFIKIRSIIYSRKVLFDVGVAGPIAGFVVLLPALAVGLTLSRIVPGAEHRGDLVFGTPAVLWLLERLFFPGVASADIYLHPVARAAWVGVFATALNLLPIGQLDGGHILYAFLGEKHRLVSRAAILALIPLGFVYWPWWVWAVVFFFLGRRHPYIFDERRLDPRRRLLGLLALIIFLLCFMPAPIRT